MAAGGPKAAAGGLSSPFVGVERALPLARWHWQHLLRVLDGTGSSARHDARSLARPSSEQGATAWSAPKDLTAATARCRCPPRRALA